MVTLADAGSTGLVAWRRGRPGGTADDGKHAVAVRGGEDGAVTWTATAAVRVAPRAFGIGDAEVGPTVGAERQCGRRQGAGSREASKAGQRSAPAQCPRADGGFDGGGALWRHW